MGDPATVSFVIHFEAGIESMVVFLATGFVSSIPAKEKSFASMIEFK